MDAEASILFAAHGSYQVKYYEQSATYNVPTLHIGRP